MNVQEIRENLLKRQEDIIRRLSLINKDKTKSEGPLEADLDEQAVSLENDEVLDALDEQGRIELKQIQATLYKMDLGEYGSCIECGEPIGESRLKALPYALACIKCASSH